MEDKSLDILRISRDKGVFLELNNGGLSLKSEKGEIDSLLLGIIKENKEDIIKYLEKLKKNGVKNYLSINEKVIAYDKTGMTHIPLSYSQERLWFIDKIQGSIQYHMPVVLSLKGNLDREVLEMTFQSIVARHQVLCTVIKEEEGIGYQELLEPAGWKLGFEQASSETELRKKLDQFMSARFDLAADYMMRACIFEVKEGEYILAVVFHHISSDGWSNDIVMAEFVEMYDACKRGVSPRLPKLTLQYQDYAIWQRKHISGEFLEDQLKYWSDKLSGVSPLELPTDYVRPAVQSIAGSTLSFNIDKELTGQLNMLCKKEGVTMYMLLLAAFKVLLYRYSGQEDICVGSPIAGRTQGELEGVVGFFVNMLALRSDLSGNPSFTKLMNEVRSTTLDAYDHQQVPFEKIVERVVKTRDRSRNPLFQVMFTLQNAGQKSTGSSKKFEGLSLSRFEHESDTSKFDLNLSAGETGEEILYSLEYCTALFSKERIQQMGVHYCELLRSIVKDHHQPIGKLAMLQPSEEQQLLNEFNNTAVDYPKNKTVIDLFREQVIKTPANTAVVFEGKNYSYQELDEHSNRLAGYLASLGVTTEALVPICMERGIEMIVGMLGIIKAGGAYVPIAHDYPQERVSFILEDTGAALLLSSGNTLDKLSYLPESVKLVDIGLGSIPQDISGNEYTGPVVSSNNLMYIIYTSGSTGKPKGVMIEHTTAINTILSQVKAVGVQETDRCLQFINTTFDVSVAEIFSALLSGASLYIIKDELKYDIDQFVKFVVDNQVTIANLPPAFFGVLPADQLDCIRVMTTAGEQAVFEQSKLFAQKGRFINAYGPTECSIYATAFEGKIEDKIPIGRPISNTQIYILDKQDNLSPLGAAGELCIGGAGLARGYLNREELTNEKFVPNLFKPGERMYRTGDLARWLPDGNIEFLGRKDDQVKIRGYRIELGEIENVLLALEGIKSCCVLARPDSDGNKRLIGYVVKEEGMDKSYVETKLKAQLPEYMIPRLWVELDTMPLTSNGKIDRKSLPDPDNSTLSSKEYVAPRTLQEEQLAAIWMELLGVQRAGINDNFFELGGHSLLATRLVSRIRTVMGAEVGIKDIFDFPTIEAMALFLDYNKVEEEKDFKTIISI